MRFSMLRQRSVVIWSLVSLGLFACLAPYIFGWKELNLTWRDVEARQLQPMGGAELPRAFVFKRQIAHGAVLDADMVELAELRGEDLTNQKRVASGKVPARLEDVVGRVLLTDSHAGLVLLESDLANPLRDDTPVRDVLPPPAAAKVAAAPAWNVDLAKVPEVSFTSPQANLNDTRREAAVLRDHIRRIKHLSKDKVDGFMAHLADQRDDLRGLPFQMGEACKMDPQVVHSFETAVNVAHQGRANPRAAFACNDCVPLTDAYLKAKVAALVQIYGPESEAHHQAEVKELASIAAPAATNALAKVALFAPESAVRAKALEALKIRRDADVTPVLWEGLHYPLPAVAQRAAVAIGTLKRDDMIPKLLDFLDAEDPRAPATRDVNGKRETVVREMVRINHHRNCLLCHAPGDDAQTVDRLQFGGRQRGEPLTVAIPLPSEPLPQPSPSGGYQSHSLPFPDVTVRTDITYLRQDFSMFMPVAKADPWPKMQRFDFLVRTRVVSEEQANVIREGLKKENGRRTPYQEATLDALRRLTKQDTAPNADAWRTLLKLPKAS